MINGVATINSRIHVDLPLQCGEDIELPADSAHHLVTVLRLKQGATLVLFNGDGCDYTATLINTRKPIRARIEACHPIDTESPLSIHLLQGVSRNDRMDTTLQKSVELGVSSITPLLTEHSRFTLKGDRLAKKHDHWRRIVISASEQSGRAIIPALAEPVTFEQWLKSREVIPTFMLDPSARQSFDSTAKIDRCALLTGPESGFSQTEVQASLESGIQGIRLGPRILRTETAAPAAIAILQSMFGDYT